MVDSGIPPRGKFISFEGVDGAGKTTHLSASIAVLCELGVLLHETREPGGTPLGERLRDLLLHQPMSIETEALLMFAARQQHLTEVIEPKLASGTWVVSDRFTDATFAYQGGGRGLPLARLAILEQWVQGDFRPDLTIVFDVPPEVSYERVRGARDPDRFEREDQAFFERVRATYLARAVAAADRFWVIDANRPIAEIQAELKARLCAYVSLHANAGVSAAAKMHHG